MCHFTLRSGLLLLVVLLASPASAAKRIALLVGANTGWEREPKLRYAEEDAQRLGATLTELGGFAADNVDLVRTPTVTELREKLQAVKQQIEASPKEEVFFIFYYSGHADNLQLHLHGDSLPLEELYGFLRGVKATVKLGILDACQSGAIFKGVRPSPSFEITVRDELAVRGTIILTSSGADELSQEANHISGSFFTHHLVSGLRGAADEDGDLRVSLDEVYRYASLRTRMDTAPVSSGGQRPAFLYDLKGRGRLYLSRLKGPSAVLLFPPGDLRCFVTDLSESRLVAERSPWQRVPTRLSIPAGSHLLKCLDDQSYKVARLDAKPGEEWDVTQFDFYEVPFSEGVLNAPNKGREPVEAFAQRLAEFAEQVHPQHLELSVLLATESLRRAPSLKAQIVLRRGMERLPPSSSCVMEGEEVLPPLAPHLFTRFLWNPSEDWLTTSRAQKEVCAWDMTAGELLRLQGGGQYKDMFLSPDGKVLVTATAEQPVRVWDLPTGHEKRRIDGTDGAHLLILSPEGKRLATAQGTLARVWDVESGRLLAHIPHEDFIHALAFNPSGQLLASASQDGAARIWKATTGVAVKALKHEGPVRSLAFSPDGKRLATGSEDRTARIWAVSTGKQLARLEHRIEPCESPSGSGLTLCEMSQLMDTTSRVGTVVFSPDGKYVATESLDAVAWLWDAKEGRELLRQPHLDHVRTLAFSPDGQALAIASGGSDAVIWSVETRQELLRLTQEDGVAFLQYSADGRHLMTVSGKGSVHIFHADSGREFASVLEDSALEAALLTPNSQHVVSARENRGDGKVSFSLYAWWAEDLVAQACARLSRNLSQDEWHKYVGEQEPYLKTCVALP